VKRIFDLARRVEAHPSQATRALQAFVASHAFPLVDGDTAIFFFWDPAGVDSVHLVHWVFGLESRQPFLRLGDTAAWYLPLELPRRARVEYKLEVTRGGTRSWVRDPLNDRRAFDPFGSNSVCPMPGYVEPRWATPEPGNRPGTVEPLVVQSQVWGQPRTVDVYLPNEYRRHKRARLLICHDGRDYQHYAGMVAVLDNLIQRHEVAPLVVAFTSGVHRNDEYAANPLQARFVATELLPALQERYSLSEDPRDRGLMGASFGAVTSLFTAWQHPGLFGQLLLQSGSFVFTDVGRHDRGPLFDRIVPFVNAVREDPGRIDARLFLSCGTFESLIAYNRALLPVLREAGVDVIWREAQDGHNWIAWRDQLRAGLSALFPGALWMTYD
jgi:enterochelin esterase family protein